MFEEKGEPKRGVEPASFRLPAERLTTRPSRLTYAGAIVRVMSRGVLDRLSDLELDSCRTQPTPPVC